MPTKLRIRLITKSGRLKFKKQIHNNKLTLDLTKLIIEEHPKPLNQPKLLNQHCVTHNNFPFTNIDPHSSTPQVSTYYIPNQIQTAYGMNLLSPSDHNLLGTGVTVAVIIAYNYSR